MILGIVIRHEAVVEVVITTHSNKEDGLRQILAHILCTTTAFNLFKTALKVLDLLVEWNTDHMLNETNRETDNKATL